MATLDPWEARWAPYDEATYRQVLAAIGPADTVLDIGAGDLRLARRMAAVARAVVAWERQPAVLAMGRRAGSLPANLWAVACDARQMPVPAGVTVAVLLMRHCAHFALYVARLRAAGCRRLVTNARWRMGVEAVDLAPGIAFSQARDAWYACRRCGAVGWAGEDAAAVDAAALEQVIDVEGCPACGEDQRAASWR